MLPQPLKKRIENFDKLDDLELSGFPITKKPDCESQVVILFAAIMANEYTKNRIKYIDKIGHYSHLSSTDMICIDKDNNKVLVEIEYKLSNLFKHDHVYNTFDCVICYIVDLDINEKKKLPDGNILNLVYDQGEWMLKYGTQKIIPIIELRSILIELDKEKSSKSIV